MHATLSTPHETALCESLSGVLAHFGGAIEYWTIACLSQRELGNPSLFIDQQWTSLREHLQELRGQLNQGDSELSEAVFEQIAKLGKSSVELREVFDCLMNALLETQTDIEAAVMKLAKIWQDVRMRVWLLGALIPLDSPPSLTTEKEAYYQSILDGLFDRFVSARAASGAHLRNGKVK